MDRPDLIPGVFNVMDALTFGGAALIATVLAGIATYRRDLNKHKAWWQWVGLWTVVALFWAGYAVSVQWRYDLTTRVLCATEHGLVLVAEDPDAKAPSCDELKAETERVLKAWDKVWLPGQSAAALHSGVMVFVKKMPFGLHGKPPEFAGFAKPYFRAIAVGFDGRPLERTALGHELGHIIMHEVNQDGSEKALKDIADRFGVPY